MLDPLAAGAVLYRRGDFKSLAGAPREETLWLLGVKGLAEFDSLPSRRTVWRFDRPRRQRLFLHGRGRVGATVNN